ncbi:MAG: 16S rRNA processing protein RimM [Rhodospirillales bacterium]|nr:16S rRNA processing protein RimM [Rhodospirillales bacterium]
MSTTNDGPGTRAPAAQNPGAAKPRLVCVGAIAGAHGVRGAVKVKSFTAAAADVTAYGPLSDESGKRRFVLTPIGQARGEILARIDGVEDRDQAEALRGTRLYADRASFPAPDEDEFYHADLIGLAAEDRDGAALGVVRAVYNHGAGDMVEIALRAGGTALVPFTKAAVPVIDLQGGRVVVEMPQEAGEASDA